MVSRIAVGFHAPRTGLGFLFSLISQSPLKFHISCYEIWHTSGFFPLFLGSSQLSADSLREPAALPPSVPLSVVLEGLVPAPSLPADGLLGAGCPFHPFCRFKMLLSLAALPQRVEAKLSHYTSGHPFCITALLFAPTFNPR